MASLIVAGVTSLGFTSSGIAAGSTAAWMMSVAAPVASGGVVAACQSIGATGAVSATTAVVANSAAGVAVGGGIVKTVSIIRRYLQGNPDDSDNSDDDSDSSDDSPDSEGSNLNSKDESPNSKYGKRSRVAWLVAKAASAVVVGKSIGSLTSTVFATGGVGAALGALPFLLSHDGSDDDDDDNSPAPTGMMMLA